SPSKRGAAPPSTARPDLSPCASWCSRPCDTRAITCRSSPRRGQRCARPAHEIERVGVARLVSNTPWPRGGGETPPPPPPPPHPEGSGVFHPRRLRVLM